MIRRRLARRPFYHGADTRNRGKLTLEAVMADLRSAIRSLYAAPGFTFIALVVLTLGIGATTAIFSVVDAVVLRGLPFDEHDRLVAVGERRPLVPGEVQQVDADPEALMSVAPQNYWDWAARQEVFESMAAVSMLNGALTLHEAGAEPDDLQALKVTASFFDVLRLRPVLGRAFTAENEVDGRHRVAVLSDGLWRRRFGGDPQLVGGSITLDDGPYEVVGILPPGVTYPLGAKRPTDLYLPYVLAPFELTRTPGRYGMYLQVVARLRPAVSIDQARAAMTHIATALEQEHPVWNKDRGIGMRPLSDQVVGARMKSWMLMLLGCVAIVLTIACANVANLQLARASVREREIAVRAALGAGRWRLLRQLLVESLVLSMVGSLLAVLVSYWAVDLLRYAMPEDVPRVAAIAVDWRVLTAAAAVSLITGLAFGIVPAWQLSKPNLNRTLKENTRGASSGRVRQRLRQVLVVSEVALALVLLVGAALFIASFISVIRIHPGVDTHNVLSVQVTPPVVPGSFVAAPNNVLADIVRQIEQRAGVEQAAVIFGGLPLRGGNMSGQMRVPGRVTGDERINIRLVSADYHRVLRIPLKRGRLFDDGDRDDSAPVALINELARRRFFGGEDPIGQAITVQRDRTIVGVVGDVHQSSPEVEPLPEAYFPLTQFPLGKGYAEIIVRTAGNPYAVLPAVKAAVFEVLPRVPVRGPITLEELYAQRTAQRRISMFLLGLFGLLGLVISAAGIYGVTSFTVSQRTHEIGIRMALGATRLEVVRMVLANVGLLLLTGLIVGSAGAWYLSATAKAFLFRLEPTDPRAFAVALALLSSAALVAVIVPAARAARVNPIVALRTE